MRAALYLRISDDRRARSKRDRPRDEESVSQGVIRQREDCLALAERRRWPVVATYVDDDVSAYSGKPRPRYRALLQAIDGGLVDIVLAWHPDRLHRSPVELEEFIVLVERTGCAVETVQAGEWDLSTPSGRLIARQLGSIARYESEHKAERVRRAMRHRAEHGQAHGRRAFGWQRVYEPDGTSREVLDPVEADVIRNATKRVLAGDALRAIAVDLDASGIAPPGGPRWTASAVRSVLLRERNAGRLVRHGEVVGQGNWEPVLDEVTYDQLRAVLRDPVRRTSTGTAAKYLLSGLGRCGVCGGRLRSSTAGGKAQYKCEHNCLARNRERVDEFVERVIVGVLSREDAADVFTSERVDVRVALDEAKQLRDRLDVAADSFAEGKIDERQLERITARLRPQIRAAELKLRVVDSTPVLEDVAGRPDAAQIWAGLPLSRRRAILDVLMVVTLLPTKKGARFNPDTVKVTWRAS